MEGSRQKNGVWQSVFDEWSSSSTTFGYFGHHVHQLIKTTTSLSSAKQMSAQSALKQPFLLSSCEGIHLCRSIISRHLLCHPHDVQIEGICKLLDGVEPWSHVLVYDVLGPAYKKSRETWDLSSPSSGMKLASVRNE